MSRGTTVVELLAVSQGTTLVELLVALALTSLGVAALALVSAGVQGSFSADPAAAEQQQRGHTTMAVLVEDIARAGAGFVGDPDMAPGLALPAVVPDLVRRGAWAVAAVPSTLTVLAGARTAAHTTLRAVAASGQSGLLLTRPGYCSAASPTCRFATGDDVLLAGGDGGLLLASLGAVVPPLDVMLTSPLPYAMPVDTTVAVLDAHGYALRADPASGLQQVVRTVGTGPATTLVDFVERFDVEWIVDGAVPTARLAPDGTLEHVSHGPRPPPAGVIGDTAWPAGENCAFTRDAGGAVVSRLSAFGAGPTQVPLSVFADGPWCPSPVAPARWDADLSRVVALRIRLVVAVATEAHRPLLPIGGPGARTVPPLTFMAVVSAGRAGERR